jgi:hypothetical protein
VTYETWTKIDEKERELGKVKGKLREKILDKNQMLELVK